MCRQSTMLPHRLIRHFTFGFVVVIGVILIIKIGTKVRRMKMPTIYAVTPTYARLAQKADLTRLCNTVMHVKNFHWIIVEDSPVKTKLVTNFLQKCHVKTTHLNVFDKPKSKRIKGIAQRNLALGWIHENVDLRNEDGVIYFMDDDNTYDLRIFEQMRHTKKVSVWPVAFVAKLLYERPFVEQGKVVGWRAVWRPDRKFPVDMAGFAVNLRLIAKHPDVRFNTSPKDYAVESDFLTDLEMEVSDLEPLAYGCTQILVWHTKTEESDTSKDKYWKQKENEQILEV